MSGSERIKRNQDDLLELRLTFRRVEERAGRDFAQHPLAAEPDSVIVTQETGRPCFLYEDGLGVRTYGLWGEPPLGRDAMESYVEGSLIKVRRYSPGGRLIEEITDLKDGPRWEP